MISLSEGWLTGPVRVPSLEIVRALRRNVRAWIVGNSWQIQSKCEREIWSTRMVYIGRTQSGVRTSQKEWEYPHIQLRWHTSLLTFLSRKWTEAMDRETEPKPQPTDTKSPCRVFGCFASAFDICMVQELKSFVSMLVSLQVWNISHVCLACLVSHSSKRHHASKLLQTLQAPYRSDVCHIGHLRELFQPGFSYVSCSCHCWTSVVGPGPPNSGSACRQRTKGIPNKRMNWNRQNETFSTTV